MPDFWDSIKNTTESLGGAAVAPLGAVYDLAQMPFDDKDDDLGSILSVMANRLADVTDPILNPETLGGAGVHAGLDAANWSLDNLVNRPISTGFIMASHLDAEGNSNDLSTLFDSDAWSQAYRISDEQNAGQSFAFTFDDDRRDPYALAEQGVKPYDAFAEQNPVAAPVLSWGANIIGAWYLDPFAIAGTGLGALRAATYHHRMGNAERADLFNVLSTDSKSAKRVDKYLDWTEGANPLGRPLEGPEILYGTPELRKYSADAHVVSGLLADANKIGDDALRRDTKRRILSVAAGDTSQIGRLRTEVAESGAIADTLKNMSRKSTLDLEHLAADPLLASRPEFVARLEGQLKNLNSDKAIDRFMDSWNSRLDQILDTSGTMPNLPGVHAQGNRAILRQNDKGALRTGTNKLYGQLDEWSAKHFAEIQGTSSLYQKGRHTVPLLVIKTAGLAASPYTKFPVKVSNALRQTHFTGVANLHDWGGATTQLDSMMKLSHVPQGERLKTLSEAFIAKSEPEKQRMIERVENLSMQSLAQRFADETGETVDRGFIEKLMADHATRRGRSLTHMRGRAYAATGMPPAMGEQMALRQQSIGAAQDQAGSLASKGLNWGEDSAAKWRVDQILDDSGVPVALPLLESQLTNSVPLLDMGMAKMLLKREFSPLARMSRSWSEDAMELGRLTELKRLGATNVDRAIASRRAAMDWTEQAATKAMRFWKFGVLFRLGYPMRVLMDDHWRIWTQMNAATFYKDNGSEFFRNVRGNVVDRRLKARRDLHNLKVQRQQILDELEGDRMIAHPEIRADFAAAKRSVGGHRAQATKLRKQIEEAETKKTLGLPVGDIAKMRASLKAQEDAIAEKEGAFSFYQEQLGDYGPEDLKRQLETIKEALALGSKALREPKRTIGTGDVLIDGQRFPGAYNDLGWSREATRSQATFEYELKGAEETMVKAGSGGAHRTINPDEPGHVEAWANILNYQFANSEVARFFLKGGSVDDFARWIKEPEQAALRERVSHYAHDAEDWGYRVQALVHDYVPNDVLRQRVLDGKVSSKFLSKHFQNPTDRPAVHGRSVADNLGTSERALGISKTINRVYKYIGEMPTDRLSRQPFFNSMYRTHLNEQYAIRKAGYAKEGKKFTQTDVDELAKTARGLALHDLRRTLYDLSAHSHAAHVMRFVSPFFAAHQEVLSRWWRIVGDSPQVVRRFTQVFDTLRQLELVVDENGELVKPGEPISREHRLLLQLPRAFGGEDPEKVQSKWSISENSFNLILQGGLANPGAGPLVTVPVEYLAQKYADRTEVARVARVFNPFPPTNPIDTAMPATLKRLSAAVYAKTGVDPSLIGAGTREYNNSYSQNVQDMMVDFQLKNGREPGKQESEEIMLRAGRETNVDMRLRLLWNAGSPFPAQPRSKYSAVQHGWYRISEQARAEKKDYAWAYAQFKEKWGAAYMPLIYSESNNPAHLTGTPAEISAIRQYRGVLDRIDPTLTRVVVGAYADDLGENMQDYSPEARALLKNMRMKPGSGMTYFNSDDPATAMEEQMSRRGWTKYSELTGSLTAAAQQMGLSSYEESDQLVAVKRAAVAKLRAENWAFDKDYGSFDSTQFDRYLGDLTTIAKSPALANDPERTDIKTLSSYLALRSLFVQVLEARKAAGLGGPDAQAQEPVKAIYTQLVGQLVESNTHFETFIYNGTLERDPLLVGD